MISSQQVAVLGLDGVPFSMLRRLLDRGLMPHLAEAARRGAFMQMNTSLPAVSSVAWASFMTGVNPGEHGIFGFTDLQDGEISLKLPSFDDIRAPVLWNRVEGKRSLVVNLPFTYPARPLRGVLISGFVAPIFERAVYPASLIPWLKAHDYRTDVDSVRGRNEPAFLIRDLFDSMNTLEDVVLSLMESEPWDLFIGVITGTDRLHHFFFDACEDTSHRFHKDFIDYYRRLDGFFARFQRSLRGRTRLVVLSDHGFTSLQNQIQLNYILRTLGYLSFNRSDPQSLEDIDPSSLAFALDPTRVYVNSKARFRKGHLDPVTAVETRLRIKADLERLTLGDVGIRDSNGSTLHEPLFHEVLVAEDVYDGHCFQAAPDLVVIPRRGYDVKAAVNASAACMRDIFTGMHTHDDAFLLVDDPGFSGRLPKPNISDVAGHVLEWLK
jgi:predicted AlkP superfamily phosphohydrolase/phosphomutase